MPTKTSSQEIKSVLLDSQLEGDKVENPVLTDEEAQHTSGIIKRLRNAQQDRDQKHPEFNNKTYVEQYQDNEKIANTYLAGKKFEGDVKIASGTVEQKMFAVLSEINRLRLSPQVLAFDDQDNEMVSLGNGMTDIIFKSEEMDNDREMKLMRQLELLKQGTAFIQERWSKEFKNEKVFNKKDIGKVKGVEWTNKLKKVYDGPRRSVLYGPGVYLGNIREVGPMSKQPFIFTHQLTTYDEAKSRYGAQVDGVDMWERWKNVSNVRVMGLSTEIINQGGDNLVNNAWGLTDISEGKVEEIHYQDRFNDEYQIFLNGVPMLPVGFPLSAMSAGGEYNIERQILQVINPFFGYGRSFTMKVAEQSDILDELLRLLIIKTRKSITPAYANIGNRVISSKVLMPGRITMGLDANALQPIGQESQGATASEYQMYKMLQDNLDENTVSKQFSGQQGKSGTTAFEVGTLQKQAQKLLSLIIFSQSMMEMKLGYQRLWNLLDNWFEPVDTKFSETRQAIVGKYRTTSRKTELGKQGEGIRQVIPTEKLPTAGQIMSEETRTGVAKGNTRKQAGLAPMKRIYIKPSELRKMKIMWYIEVDTTERETSNAKKLLFREELRDLFALINLGSKPNISELEQQHSLIWNRPKDKLFSSGQKAASNAAGSGAQEKQKSAAPGGPGNIAPPDESQLSAVGIE